MANRRTFKLDKTLVLAGLLFFTGFYAAMLYSSVFTSSGLSDVMLENISGVGVRSIQISYVSASEDGDLEVEISPSQEPVLHVGFYLSADADFTIEANLTDGSVVYGQYDALAPGGKAYMRLTESRIEKR